MREREKLEDAIDKIICTYDFTGTASARIQVLLAAIEYAKALKQAETNPAERKRNE
jgi:hypothetical protein